MADDIDVILPHGNSFGNSVDIVVLIFGPVVHGAREGVHPAVCVQRLRRDLRFQVVVHTGLGLSVIGKQVVVEFGAFELPLKGPGGAGVRFGDIAVIASGDAQRFGRGVGAVDGGLGLDGVVPSGGSESGQVRFGFGRIVRVRERID